MLAGHIAWQNGVIDKILNATERADLSEEQQGRCILKWYGKRNLREKIEKRPDQLSRERAQLYIGIEDWDGERRAAFRPVDVPRYFLERLKRENEAKEAKDREAINLRYRIKLVQSRVYSSRGFPASLKAIIFERDNYTCKMCLRDQVKLLGVGLHLECDHILAWEDGGMTTYDNGQTVCSECNKAKHHSKAYFGLVARLRAS